MDDVRTRQPPGDELIKMWRRRPLAGSPVRDWVAWLEPQPALWEEIAADNAALAPNARFVADYVRGMVKELQEDFTASQPWSGVASW